jgi:transposase
MKTEQNQSTERKILRVSYGVDISSESFVASCGVMYDDLKKEVNNAKSFSNNNRGFDKLLSHTKKHLKNLALCDKSEIWFVMEASGVYYENLAYFLYKKGYNVHVALANKVKNFTRTMENKSKNDVLDSRAISQYGLEKDLKSWKPMDPVMKKLKELTRELLSTKDTAAEIKNKLHAKKNAHEMNSQTIKRLNQQIDFFKNQIKKINGDINNILRENPELKEKIDKITVNLKGVGQQTVVTVISETNKFTEIENRRQLTSFVGMDVIENQSGKRTGKTRISKKGNSIIRKSLYLPAIGSIRYDKKMNSLYQRVCERHGWESKKIGITAVMRKLLHVIYALWKNDTVYDPNYGITKFN